MRPAIVAALAVLLACKAEVTAVDAAPLASTTPSAAPAASIACTSDSNCVAVHSPCCSFWPANTASRALVKTAIQATDGERCKDRLCPMPLVEAKCDRGICVVHPASLGPLGR